MSFDSAVPVEGIEEKSTVVKRVDKDTTQQKAVKDNLGKLANHAEVSIKARDKLPRNKY